MEALRRQLDIKMWNLYGVSYGTRYAQVMARDYPGSVESMILDAATFPDIRYTERAGADFLRSFERLFDYCEHDSSCRNRLGDIRGRFWALVESLENDPPDFVVPDPYSGQDITVALTGVRFLNAYFNALYDADFYLQLPDIVNSLEHRELGEFENVLILWLYFIMDRDYGDGAAIAHYCHEEAPFVDIDKTIANLQVLPELIRDVAVQELQATFRQCRRWNIAPAAPLESQPANTNIPTLFLHGALDPVLPVEDLENQMSTFTSSANIVFDDISHTIIGVHPCAIEIANSFYRYKLSFRDNVSCEL
jgi:pimeloyl-ACP methyl ester carboxylesterase